MILMRFPTGFSFLSLLFFRFYYRLLRRRRLIRSSNSGILDVVIIGEFSRGGGFGRHRSKSLFYLSLVPSVKNEDFLKKTTDRKDLSFREIFFEKKNTPNGGREYARNTQQGKEQSVYSLNR